jgi:murein DD-endopeptidase MepM/ murein hydrolase activator NlpD/GH24 family phage-related lysozyme (muramidase)
MPIPSQKIVNQRLAEEASAARTYGSPGARFLLDWSRKTPAPEENYTGNNQSGFNILPLLNQTIKINSNLTNISNSFRVYQRKVLDFEVTKINLLGEISSKLDNVYDGIVQSAEERIGMAERRGQYGIGTFEGKQLGMGAALAFLPSILTKLGDTIPGIGPAVSGLASSNMMLLGKVAAIPMMLDAIFQNELGRKKFDTYMFKASEMMAKYIPSFTQSSSEKLFEIGSFLSEIRQKEVELAGILSGGDHKVGMKTMRAWQLAPLLMTPANLIHRNYKTPQEKQVALLSGMYEFLREMTAWQITIGRHGFGLSDNIFSQLTPIKNGPFARLDRYLQDIPVISAGYNIIKDLFTGTYKLADVIFNPVKYIKETFGNLKSWIGEVAEELLPDSFRGFLESKGFLQKTIISSEDAMKGAGLNQSSSDRANIFTAEGLPGVLEKIRSLNFQQYNTLENIYNILDKLLRETTKTSYRRKDLKGESLVWSSVEGKYLSKSENDQSIKKQRLSLIDSAKKQGMTDEAEIKKVVDQSILKLQNLQKESIRQQRTQEDAEREDFLKNSEKNKKFYDFFNTLTNVGAGTAGAAATFGVGSAIGLGGLSLGMGAGIPLALLSLLAGNFFAKKGRGLRDWYIEQKQNRTRSTYGPFVPPREANAESEIRGTASGGMNLFERMNQMRTSIPFFAEGGIAKNPQMAVVGEKEPEVIGSPKKIVNWLSEALYKLPNFKENPILTELKGIKGYLSKITDLESKSFIKQEKKDQEAEADKFFSGIMSVFSLIKDGLFGVFDGIKWLFSGITGIFGDDGKSSSSNILSGILGTLGNDGKSSSSNILSAVMKNKKILSTIFGGGSLYALADSLIGSYVGEKETQDKKENITSFFSNPLGFISDKWGEFTGIKGFSKGGTIPTGGIGFVGEKGPELAISGPNGTNIYPIEEDKIKALIKKHESDGVPKLRSYLDSRNIPTIGYGHNLKSVNIKGLSENSVLTPDEAERLFNFDYQRITKPFSENFPSFNKFNYPVKAALYDMAFNMGPSFFKNWPNFVSALERDDYESAIKEVQNSKYFSQVGKGRTDDIIALLRMGGDPSAIIPESVSGNIGFNKFTIPESFSDYDVSNGSAGRSIFDSLLSQFKGGLNFDFDGFINGFNSLFGGFFGGNGSNNESFSFEKIKTGDFSPDSNQTKPQPQFQTVLGSIVSPSKSNIVNSPFGLRNDGRSMHGGVDFQGKIGDPVFASRDGTVSAIFKDWGGVQIDHGDGTAEKSIHMSKIFAKNGEFVRAGQKIGEVGGVGPIGGETQYRPHLHWAYLQDGSPVDGVQVLQNAGLRFRPQTPTGKISNIASVNEKQAIGGDDPMSILMSVISKFDKNNSLKLKNNSVLNEDLKNEILNFKESIRRETVQPQVIPIPMPSQDQQTSIEVKNQYQPDMELMNLCSMLFSSVKGKLINNMEVLGGELMST